MPDDQSRQGAPQAVGRAGEREGAPTVRWDDSKMTTSFANVVNAASSREEVTVFFGTNQTWNVSSSKELVVQLSDRIILTPFAAKRLWTLLGRILHDYETRFGKLNLESSSQPIDVRGSAGNGER